MADFQDLSDYIRLSKDALDLVKSAAGLLPKGAAKNEAEQKLKAADEVLRRTDAKLAKDLGYKLCQCTFPPQIMLWKQESHMLECPACGYSLDPARRSRTSVTRSGFVSRY